MIVWREKMSVGHEVIDADHRYLLCLVNSVELALRTDEPLDELLDQLVDYVKFHFKREEGIQMDVRYPNIEKHRSAHRQLADQLAEAVAKLRQADKPTPRRTPSRALVQTPRPMPGLTLTRSLTPSRPSPKRRECRVTRRPKLPPSTCCAAG